MPTGDAHVIPTSGMRRLPIDRAVVAGGRFWCVLIACTRVRCKTCLRLSLHPKHFPRTD